MQWVAHYNEERPHQGIGMVSPAKRFELAVVTRHGPPARLPSLARASPARIRRAGYPPRGTLRQDQPQRLRATSVGSYLAGETVTVTFTDNGLVEISHRGVLITSHARRRPPHTSPAREQLPRVRHARVQPAAQSVVRLVDPTGYVSFAGTGYSVGTRHRRKQVEVRLAGDIVEIRHEGMLLRAEPAKHDRSKEHRAFATPTGRPRRPKASQDQDSSGLTELLEPMWNAGGGT